MSAIFGVFLDTIIVCTVTASVILLSGQVDSGLNGIELTQLSFASLFGDGASYGLAMAILFFAWTSMIASLFYGEANMKYLFPGNDGIVKGYRCFASVLIVIGALTSVPLVWELADFFNAFGMVSNIICIVLMFGLVIRVMKDYDTQYRNGNKDPV